MKNLRVALVFILNLKLGTHSVRGDGGQVKYAYWVTGVGWLGPEIAVGISEISTDRLGKPDLRARIQEVLTR